MVTAALRVSHIPTSMFCSRLVMRCYLVLLPLLLMLFLHATILQFVWKR
jgi:hypothetical protein